MTFVQMDVLFLAAKPDVEHEPIVATLLRGSEPSDLLYDIPSFDRTV